MSIYQDQNSLSYNNGAITNYNQTGGAPRPVPVAQANPTKEAYDEAQRKAWEGQQAAEKAQQERANWAAQQVSEAQQTGAGATGGRNNSAWQEQARYGYSDPYAQAKTRYTAAPGAKSEGAVDWNMFGTGGAYEEKERKDAQASMNAWRNDDTYNRAALRQYNDRSMDRLTMNTGDVRESWRDFQDLDTGEKVQQNVRRGMGGTPVNYAAMGNRGMAMNSQALPASGFMQRNTFGGGGMAQQRGTYDGVPERKQNPYTQAIRWS